jgi:hypothetical protein
MNFKKLMIAVAAVAVLIVIWKFATRVDHSSPLAVANAFTSAMKKSDVSTASRYFVPDKAEAWRAQMDERMQGMKSGSQERFLERIPASPAFTGPATVAGKTMIVSGDKSFSLEMTQVDGKWYVAKTDFQ